MAKSPQLQSVVDGDTRWIILRKDGTVEEWGKNFFTEAVTPAQVLPLGQRNDITNVAGGYTHSAALTKDGALITWGADPAHLLSSNPRGAVAAYEETAPSGTIAIATGNWGDLLLTDQGEVMFRRIIQSPDDPGKLDISPPTHLWSNARRISASENRFAVLNENNRLFLFRAPGDTKIPIPQATPPCPVGPTAFVEIAQAPDLLVGLTKSGAVFHWGNNFSDFGDRKAFVQVQDLQKVDKISCLPSGILLAHDKNGAVWSWGSDMEASPEPVAIAGAMIPLLFSSPAGQAPSPWHLEAVLRRMAAKPLSL